MKLEASLKTVTYVLQLITFVFSIPNVVFGIYFKTTDVCRSSVGGFIIFVGVFLMIFTLVGFIAAFYSVKWLVWVYFLAMLSLNLFFLVFVIFVLVVTNNGSGEVLSNRNYKEYRLRDHTNFLQKRVDDSNRWNRIKSCLIDWKVCQKLAGESNTPEPQFFQKHLSPIQSSCCKPPENCKFTYVAPTNWTKTGTPTNPDCNAWDNNPSTLCYNCTSCKAGFLQNSWLFAITVTSSSSSLSTLPVVVLSAIILIHRSHIVDI